MNDDNPPKNLNCWQQVKATAGARKMQAMLFCTMVGLAVMNIVAMGSVLRKQQEEELETKIDPEISNICQWTVLAGDSNMRGVYQLWKAEESKRTDRLVINRRRIGKITSGEGRPSETKDDSCVTKGYYKNKDKVERHSDHEMLILRNSDIEERENRPSSCHIVSQRFFRHQHEVDRFVKNSTDFDFCGTSLTPAFLPPEYRRPKYPDTVWISHGLWFLPNQGQNYDNLNCTTRFDSTVNALHTLNSTSNVVWQTLFPINHHPTIRNKYLDWDIRCQKETASREGLQIFDLAGYVKNKTTTKAVAPDDYHLNVESQVYVLRQIMETCCGGVNSYFPP